MAELSWVDKSTGRTITFPWPFEVNVYESGPSQAFMEEGEIVAFRRARDGEEFYDVRVPNGHIWEDLSEMRLDDA